MKNKLQLILLIMLTGLMTRAQISGTYTIGPGETYPTIASAIAALNVAGVGPGGVTFNVPAGYTETFTSNTSGLISYANGTETNPIVFQKSGTGANPIIRPAAGVTTDRDYIICLKGATWVTFDGIDLEEINISTPTTRSEWGYAILKKSAAKGSQHNTIKNCAINLNSSTYTASWAVYLNNHSPEVLTQYTVASDSGTSSYNTFSGLTISTTYSGIRLQGYNDLNFPTFFDKNNQVVQCTLTNLGGTTSACYGMWLRYQNNIVVANNAIGGTTPVMTGGINGIILVGSNANCEVYNNTINFTYMGTSGVTGIDGRTFGDMGTNNTTNYHHNTISISAPSMTGSFTSLQINLGTSGEVYNNNITNNVMGSSTVTPTGLFSGLIIFRNNIIQTLIRVHDNLVSGNTRIQSTPTFGNNLYLYLTGTTVTSDSVLTEVYNNTIENNTAPDRNGVTGLALSGSMGMKVYNNIVRNNQAGQNNYGIVIYPAYPNIHPIYFIYNNKVQNLSTIGSLSSAAVYGIKDEGYGKNYWYNNLICELKAPNCPNPTYAVVGADFSFDSYSENYLYNNTIYLDANSSGSNFGTRGIRLTTLKYLEMANNIIVNNSSSNGTSRTVVLHFMYGGLTNNPNMYGAGSNNNLLYSATPRSLIHYNDYSAIDSTLAQFQARVAPRDNSSVTELPPFVNVAAPPYDVHLKTDILTQCESGGKVVTTPVNITADFDLDPRYPNPGYPENPSFTATAPDIGADEFGGIGLDVAPPGITFTPLINTASLTARTLTTSIADPSGVPASGSGLPMLYWKINAGGSWNSSVATWVSGTTYTFTLGSGVALFDSVYYYIAAQDLFTPPNVGSNPPTGTGYTADPPACSIPPANSSCFAYKIVEGLCGTYNVGVGQTYPTITAALADISGKTITCPLVFQLTDADYPSESLPINVLNYEYNGASATNTITIRPAPGVDATISGNSSTAILRLTQASYFILDGSNNGTSSRNLTLSNTATTGTTAVVWVGSRGPGAGTNGNVIKNCTIRNGYKTATSYGIFVGSMTAIGTAGQDNDNLTIENNALSSAYIGISAMGTESGQYDNLVISNNLIGSDVPESSVGLKGILLLYANAAQVTGNEIYNITGASGQMMGIDLNGALLNTLVRGNKIHDILVNTGSSGGTFGINGGTDATYGGYVFNTSLVNNLIYNIKTTNFSASSQTTNPFGIRLERGTGYKLYNNTVVLSGTQATGPSPNTSGTFSSALLIAGTTVPEMKDNILANSLVGLAGSKSYCIYMDETKISLITTSDYNDLWPSGPYGKLGRYRVSDWVGTDCNTLAAWQAASGKDANSVSADPVFASGTDFHPTAAAPNNAGIAVTGVTTDFAGVTRSNPPDIGAYEYTLAVASINTLDATSIGETTATLNGNINTNNEIVTVSFEYGPDTGYGSSIAAVPSPVKSTASAAVSANLTGLTPFSTVHFRLKGVTSGGVTVYGNDVSFTTGYRTLNLKVFLEGLYAGAGMMNKALNDTGYQFPGTTADKVTVELHNAAAYSTIEYSSGLIELGTDGNISIATIPAGLNGSYYITVKHRNSIETTTAAAVSFAGTTVSYDFTTGAGQAYGDNQKDAGGGYYAIWGGDVSQDGIVDSGDMNPVDNASTAITFGYVAEDVNGDGIVDSGDMNIVDNNSTAIIMAQVP